MTTDCTIYFLQHAAGAAGEPAPTDCVEVRADASEAALVIRQNGQEAQLMLTRHGLQQLRDLLEKASKIMEQANG